MHRLNASFILGYHGCDRNVGERLLAGEPFKLSNNDYDWLGPGIYFWEANPHRGLEFARESAARSHTTIADPFVVGAVIDLGQCLDLTSAVGLDWVRSAYQSMSGVYRTAGVPLPQNSSDLLRRNLDCAVIRRVHSLFAEIDIPPIDTVKGIFIEGSELYEGSGFREKTHTQIAVCNPHCIKGVFRVPSA